MLVVALACAVPALGQEQKDGQVPEGADNDQLVEKLVENWNVGDFDCQRGSPVLRAIASTGECSYRELRLDFTGMSGTTTQDYDYTLILDCVGGRIVGRIGFCDLNTGPCPTTLLTQDGTFTFGADDEIQLTSNEFELPITTGGQEGGATVPALGTLGAILAAAGLLGLAAFLLLRRG